MADIEPPCIGEFHDTRRGSVTQPDAGAGCALDTLSFVPYPNSRYGLDRPTAKGLGHTEPTEAKGIVKRLTLRMPVVGHMLHTIVWRLSCNTERVPVLEYGPLRHSPEVEPVHEIGGVHQRGVRRNLALRQAEEMHAARIIKLPTMNERDGRAVAIKRRTFNETLPPFPIVSNA
jgi:hypothetical protein